MPRPGRDGVLNSFGFEKYLESPRGYRRPLRREEGLLITTEDDDDDGDDAKKV